MALTLGDDLPRSTGAEVRTVDSASRTTGSNSKTLQAAGLVSFGLGYGFNVFVATNLVLSPPLLRFGYGGVKSEGESCFGDVCDSNPWLVSRHYWPLYVPVVGSLWSLGYSDVGDDAGNRFYFGTSFALQATGVGLFFAGFAAERKALFPASHRASPAPASVSIVPLVTPKARALSLVGRF
jgi:hypothetical protein